MDHYGLSSSGNGDKLLNSSVHFPSEMRWVTFWDGSNDERMCWIQVSESSSDGVEYCGWKRGVSAAWNDTLVCSTTSRSAYAICTTNAKVKIERSPSDGRRGNADEKTCTRVSVSIERLELSWFTKWSDRDFVLSKEIRGGDSFARYESDIIVPPESKQALFRFDRNSSCFPNYGQHVSVRTEISYLSNLTLHEKFL